jgi:hypothetical protein
LHFQVAAISRRMRLHHAADAFSILALGPHQFVVQLKTEPESG